MNHWFPLIRPGLIQLLPDQVVTHSYLGKWFPIWLAHILKKNWVGSTTTFPFLEWDLLMPEIQIKWVPAWWFQICFIFIPIWGRFPFWLIFLRWVETTNQVPLEVSKWLGSVDFFHLLINGVYRGCNPLILTIDPNFLGHPSIGTSGPLRHCVDVFIPYYMEIGVLPSLKRTAKAPEKIGLLPQGESHHLPTIDFQRLCFRFQGG